MIFLPTRIGGQEGLSGGREQYISCHGHVAHRNRRAGYAGHLLESSSPYGSRRVTVEYDGLTTAAYLHDDTAVISATWIANHQPAPDSIDQARLDAGRTPLMPASLIKHPGGRGPLRGSALQALWFEEGDGVAILENGQPLAVIAGWSDMDRGCRGTAAT
jgi:hypothetical protein